MPCSCFRRARGTDLAALVVALGGTLWMACIDAVMRAPARVQSVVVCGKPPTRVDPLAACKRGYSNVHSGRAHVGEAVEDGLRPALLQQACELASGQGCQVDDLIPRETALCVAEQVALGEGRAEHASLGWHTRAQRAVWTVTTPATGNCSPGRVIVDASSGRVIESRSACR